MKKNERQRQFVQRHLDLFRCPTCQAPAAAVQGNSLVCVNGHRIDFNRHGYLHFLNGAATTEYGREMFFARRQLLAAGLFKPLVQRIAQCLPTRPIRLLDVGTGEGTPLLQLAQSRSRFADTRVGFDISKPGITLATQLDLTAFFCVADLRQLPFNNERFDAVVELFSPSDYQEFNRVLAPEGELLKVVPNAGYLGELRQLLYRDDQAKLHYDNHRVVELFNRHYPAATTEQIKYQFTIPAGLQEALIEMTPLHWGKGARQLSKHELASLTTVTVDVSLLRAKKGE